jgi:sulfonate transport system substrate-binding protein
MKGLNALIETFTAWVNKRILRRALLFAIGYCLVFTTTLVSCTTSTDTAQSLSNSGASPLASSEQQVFHVVRNKQLTALAALEAQGALEKALEPLGFTVS